MPTFISLRHEMPTFKHTRLKTLKIPLLSHITLILLKIKEYFDVLLPPKRIRKDMMKNKEQLFYCFMKSSLPVLFGLVLVWFVFCFTAVWSEPQEWLLWSITGWDRTSGTGVQACGSDKSLPSPLPLQGGLRRPSSPLDPHSGPLPQRCQPTRSRAHEADPSGRGRTPLMSDSG